jgi:ZIP family zinc transporter
LVAQRSIDVLLGFAAAIMLAASFLSLIVPGIASARAIYCGARLAALIAVGLCARGAEASKSRS